jgi:rhodanese-related sulfurtransferase
MAGTGAPRTLADLLAEATERIVRLSPTEAHGAVRAGALLVDIRSDSDRARDGVVPGSLHLPRTVLEWRTAPDSAFRNPHVGGLDRQLVVLCDHGYSSVLAAATLADLGFAGAGDVIGGYEAWRAAGLPTTDAHVLARSPGEPAGMQPPDL